MVLLLRLSSKLIFTVSDNVPLSFINLSFDSQLMSERLLLLTKAWVDNFLEKSRLPLERLVRALDNQSHLARSFSLLLVFQILGF